MSDILSQDEMEVLAEKALEIAQKAGAECVDVLINSGSASSIEVRKGAIELIERSEVLELGLRTFIGQRQALVSGSDLSQSELLAMGERAVHMAREAPIDIYCGLAQPEQLAKSWDIKSLKLFDSEPPPTGKKLENFAKGAEEAARGVLGIEQAESSASYYTNQTLLMASNGFKGSYKSSSISISCTAIAGSGSEMERDYNWERRIHQNEIPVPEDIGKKAGERARARLNPRKLVTGRYPVIFDQRVSSSLISHLLGLIRGDVLVRGSSWLIDSLGETILPATSSLIEEPLRPACIGSIPFDAEGLPKKECSIVKNGKLKTYLLDLSSARKLNAIPTGHAVRGVSSLPTPSVSNIALTPGKKGKEELIAEMGTGLLITSLLGATINPNTGDYSRGAAGVWVEHGEPCYPINECTVAGNLRDMLRNFVPSNDAELHRPSRIPSILIHDMQIAGA